ncbi:MAG: crossover junction endodeoxyribonuclease RuvC [Acidobacteriota bacterium]|nr:MAG: crossover junction endodeoxyribonuclease RuvC [Acidobacteriota bacterium]
MTVSPTRILGIAPRARKTGVSVLVEGELVFYGIKSPKKADQRTTLRKIESAVEDLIPNYEINCAAIEGLPYTQQKHSLSQAVFDRVVNSISIHGIRLYQFNPKDVRQELIQKRDPTKLDVAIALGDRFPELRRYLVRQKPWNKYHYSTLFDAVAVSFYCARKLNQQLMGERKRY